MFKAFKAKEHCHFHTHKEICILHFRKQESIYRANKLVYFNCKQEVRDHKNAIKSQYEDLWVHSLSTGLTDCLCWKPALMWYSCTSLDDMAVKSWWVRKSCEKPLWRPPCFTWEQCLSSICCPQQRYMVCPSQTSVLTWNLLCDQCGSPPLLADPGTARGQLCSPCCSTGLSGTPTPACPAGGFPSLTKSLLWLQFLLQWSLCSSQDSTWTCKRIHLPDTKILE